MNSNEDTKVTSFWKFLDNNKIEIPIIQRDYAQGRKGYENVREPFISSIIKHIEDGKILKFDFVYGTQYSSKDGNEKDKIFEPLDGQQRLTSLWLLHFYILYKKNHNLSEEEKIKLSKFTYLTRDSSKDFCHELVNKAIVESTGDENEKLTNIIQNQLWFFKEWGGDPTIKAMLNMLDSIEKKFNSLKNLEEFIDKAYEHLFIADDIIRFYVLYLDNVKAPDDLYIKMNARGKLLTNFENFKSDFTDYLRDINVNKEVKKDIIASYKDYKNEKGSKEDIKNRFLDVSSSLTIDLVIDKWDEINVSITSPDDIIFDKVYIKPHQDIIDNITKKLDTKWSDLLWPYRYKYDDETNGNQDVRIDDNYFSFINRIFFCLLSEYKEKQQLSDKPKTNNVDKESDDNQSFFEEANAVLYEEKGVEKKYKAFDIYRKILDASSNAITRISNIFDRTIEFSRQVSSNGNIPFIENMYDPYKEKGSSHKNLCTDIFIPQWGRIVNTITEESQDEIGKNTKTTEIHYEIKAIQQQHYPVFYGVILYLIHNESYNKKSFEDWMRFVWNFCLSPDLKNINATLSVMNLLNLVSKYSSDITTNLSNPNIYNGFINDTKNVVVSDTKFINNQFNEELIKALLIKKYPEFEETIREMENYAFFNGSIEFLFDYKKVGDVSINDNFVEDIKKRVNIVKELFEENNDGNNVFKTDNDYLYECRSFIVGVILKLTTKRNFFLQKSIFDYKDNVTDWKTIFHDSNFQMAIQKIFSVLKDKELSKLTQSDYNQEFANISFDTNKKELKAKIDISINKMTKDLSLIRYIIKNLHNYQFKTYYNAYKIVVDDQYSTDSDKKYIIIDSDAYYRNELAHTLEDSKEDAYIVIDKKFKIEECEGYYLDFNLNFTYKEHNFVWESLTAQNHKKDVITIETRCSKEYDKWGFPLDYCPDTRATQIIFDYPLKESSEDLHLLRKEIMKNLDKLIQNIEDLIETNRKRQ